MANELTTQVFRAVRTSKAGKQSYRDMVGVLLSGTPAERTEAAAYLINEDWAKGDMASTMENIKRVFTTKVVTGYAQSFNYFLTARKSDEPRLDLENPTKRTVLVIVQCLIDADLNKGEKGKVLTLLGKVATAEAEREAQKAIRKAQFEADQAKLMAPVSGAEAAGAVEVNLENLLEQS